MASGKRVSSKSLKAGAHAEPAKTPASAGRGLRLGVVRRLLSLPLPFLVLGLIIKTLTLDIDAAVALLGAVALHLAGLGLIRQGLSTRKAGGVAAALNAPGLRLALGAGGLTAALLLAAVVGTSSPVQALAVAAFGGAGLALALFTATGATESGPAKVAGIDMADLRRQLATAQAYVKRMRQAGATLTRSPDKAQVVRLADLAQGVLEGILADPGDIRRARRFMATYLERATTSVEKFATAEAKGRAEPLRANFNATLDVIETAFTEQQQRLDADDQSDLEVQLDVLRKQMEREGL